MPPPAMSEVTGDGRDRPSRWQQLKQLVHAIAEVDVAGIEEATRRLGESKRILTPLAWAAGTIVLFGGKSLDQWTNVKDGAPAGWTDRSRFSRRRS